MLTVSELQQQRQARARVNHETYKQLLRQVQDRLRARAANNATDLLWQVPPLVPGRPVYKASHAARYVRDKLRLGGFEVTVTQVSADVQVLYITWSALPAAAAPAAKRRAKPPKSGTGGRFTVDDASRTIEKLKATLRLGGGG